MCVELAPRLVLQAQLREQRGEPGAPRAASARRRRAAAGRRDSSSRRSCSRRMLNIWMPWMPDGGASGEQERSTRGSAARPPRRPRAARRTARASRRSARRRASGTAGAAGARWRSPRGAPRAARSRSPSAMSPATRHSRRVDLQLVVADACARSRASREHVQRLPELALAARPVRAHEHRREPRPVVQPARHRRSASSRTGDARRVVADEAQGAGQARRAPSPAARSRPRASASDASLEQLDRRLRR